MRALRLLAPAKLNITLDVLRRREDGYHELDMLLLRVSLCDILHISPAARISVTYEGLGANALAPLALEGKDLVSRAVAAYRARCSKDCPIRVHVRKRIPTEAGLGGGSADAASVLNGLQYIYHALSTDALHDAALEVGADVPYCLHNDPCRAGGVGENLLFLRTAKTPLWFLLLKPDKGISTGALFSALQFPLIHPHTDGAQKALLNSDIAGLGARLQNAMQPAAATLLPEIDGYCKRLMAAGAVGAAMTGSGSCVFGLFLRESDARTAYAAFQDVPFRAVCRNIPRAYSFLRHLHPSGKFTC